MIERLTSETQAQLERVGGKAAGLVRLIRAGLDVPEAWVVPAGVSLDDGRAEELLDHRLPAWWEEAQRDHPGSLWAVRSSAVAEDLEGASFAGVYETVLAIESLESLTQAVKQCRGAVGERRAAAYLHEQGMDGAAGIALVLQRMVRPDVAGVMLTENPLRPFADQLVVDASYGLGEAVVSGKTDPDHLVLSRTSGEVLEERIGAKETEIVWGCGAVARDVDDVRRARRSLSDEQVAQLHALAGRVTAAIGERRDLEWAVEGDRLYALQDRPITGLPPRNPQTVWSRRFGDEYLAEYATPLGRDLMTPWLVGPNIDEVAELQGRPEIVALTKIRHHDGYAYINGQYVVEVARGLPLSSREGPLLSWFDGQWAERVRTVPFEPRLLVRVLRAPSKDRGRGRLQDNLVALEHHCAAIDEDIVGKLGQDYSTLSSEEWRAQVAEVDRLGEDHFRVIRWGMGHHGPLQHALLARFLKKWADDESGELYQRVISGVPGTMTAQINRDVHALGLAVRADNVLADLCALDLWYDEIRAGSGDAPFWVEFDAFLATHGHRCATREVSAPRWSETPDVVFGLVQAQARSGPRGQSPQAFEEQAVARRLEAEREALHRVGKGPAGLLRRHVLATTLQRVHDLTVYRENQRYHLDYLLNHLHLLLLEQGRRLVARGVLVSPEDVFLLSGPTFWGLVDDRSRGFEPDVHAEVELMREHRARHERKIPPTFLFDDVPTEGDGVVETGLQVEGALTGFGASSGKASGPVRTVRDLVDLAEVRAGDVLVASNIDPGWTSVFPLIAGLVTETGGVLSHGAILAREYGIPTVTGVVDALGRLEPGLRVEVDGSNGLVVVVDAAEGSAD